MKIVFLGTNGWYSSPTGDTPCILIDSKDHYVILDAGNGIYKLDQYITEDKPISLFISHFHLDHVSGIHMLHKFKFKQGIDIYVGEGRKKDLETLCNPPYTLGFQNKELDLRLNELSENGQKEPFPMQAIKLSHSVENFGYKITLDEKTIYYTGDCGLTDETRKLTKNADLLISECTSKKTESPKEGHLDPMEAATLAKDEGVKQLILTHFGPMAYPTLNDRKWAEQEARKIFPDTTAAMDGMEIEI
jgi:ribonuclease Z